jgi:uncharacterized protein (TIGR02266 family)
VRKDSESWQRLEQVPEVAAALATAVELPNLEVARIRSWLAEFRDRPIHDVFGVGRDASLEQYRVAYFRMVKAYHPARLPAGSPAELHSACVEMFQFLAKLMAAAERGNDSTAAPDRATSATTPARGTDSASAQDRPSGSATARDRGRDAAATADRGEGSVVKASPAATAERSEARKQFSYGPDEFVGIARGKDILEATVRVTHENAKMFTEHALVNLSTEGVFLPTSRPIPLGTLLDIRFVFEDSPHQIKTRGRVVWENVGVTSMAAGLGVRFIRLAKADHEFIQRFMDQATQSESNARQAG